MKLLFLFSLTASLNTFAQCDPNTFVLSLVPGVTQSGAIFSMEAGIWPIRGKVGIMAGPTMYDEKISTEKGTEHITHVDLSGRLIYKITEVGSDWPQLVTLFGTVRGLLGISYRGYMSLGESALIGIEPVYVNRLGAGVNLIITMRL
jgi:hypothetical protein